MVITDLHHPSRPSINFLVRVNKLFIYILLTVQPPFDIRAARQPTKNVGGIDDPGREV
jgi:hypothetical protein